MEKSRIAQRQQQFAEQFDELDAEIQELEVALQASATSPESSGTSTSNTSTVSPVGRLQQQLVRLHYQVAELCGQFQDYKLATVYYHKVLSWLEAREAPPPLPLKAALTRTKSAIELPPSIDEANVVEALGLSANELLLKENVLNNLAVMYFGAGDAAQAMGFLLDAKKLVRDCSAPREGEGESMEVASPSQQQCLEKTLTANYALFLHAKGHIEDAIHAATSVIEVPPLGGHGEDNESADSEVTRAKITSLCLLSSCHKAKGDDESALAFASQAAQLAAQIQDQTLLSRTHNNLALFYLERRELAIALNHLLTAYRATQATGDFSQQAVVKYHIGLVISELEVAVELPQTSRTESSTHHRSLADSTGVGISEAEDLAEGSTGVHRASTSKAVVVSAAPAPPMTSAKDCFVQSENLATALSVQDHALTFLARGCCGESEYYAGEFHTAEAEFSIALQRLQVILYPEKKKDGEPGGPGIESAELIKIQGHLLSYMGCTQLVEGKFKAAEESHQCDLEMALKYEDIHAQQRAMRNLALVYNATQRYHEAIPLWREALEIASVLQSKADQMMAYSGIGIAMKELHITDQQRGEFKELLDLKENDPLQIFLRQRALAVELGDKNQQIIAQRHIVSVYESPDRPDIEQRLAECDTLVRLCEQYENLQYRADGYRSLANALTAQLARLSARGARFAEAVSVLTEKRNSICTKYQQATKTLKAAAAVMFKAEEGEASGTDGIALKKPHAEDKHARPPISRVELLQRR